MTIHDKSFLTFIKEIRRRLRKDWDLVIAITGEEGVGKSTLAIIVGMCGDDKFDLDNNVAYMPSYKYMKDKFNSLIRYAFFLVDEAIKVLHKHQWMKRLQQGIVQLYATERSQNKCSILCVPRFRDLNENFRNHRVKVWIHIIARGVAVVYLKDKDKDVRDPWHMEENYMIKQRMFRKRGIADRDVDVVLRAEKKTTNYWFDFKFPDMNKETKKEYLKLREHYRKQYKEEEDAETSLRMEWLKECFVNVLSYCQKEKGMSVKELVDVSGLSQASIYNYLKLSNSNSK